MVSQQLAVDLVSDISDDIVRLQADSSKVE